MKSLYLAHPFEMREEIREWELGFEKKTGLNLQNPFYDADGREDIIKFDEGLLEPRTLKKKKSGLYIVEKDLRQIELEDGIVAFVEDNQKSLGTPMEFFYNSRILQKPTYTITKTAKGHPWIRGLSTKIFSSKENFEKFILKCHISKEQKE